MFASAACDLLKDNPDADEEWIEEFLLQVMLDEFEVAVDDGSAGDVADEMVRLRGLCQKGDFAEVEALKRRWESRGRDVAGAFQRGEDEEVETSGSEDEDDEDGEGDVDMDEAPRLVRTREPVVPEVDEDGFTKVSKKKR